MVKKRLTCTSRERTLSQVGQEKMEQGEKKLVEERERLRRQRVGLDRRMAAIDQALEIIGTRVPDNALFQRIEAKYGDERPFREMTLAEACKAILDDSAGDWLDKKNVEYLLGLGGYSFDAEDPTNSVDVTLRRMARDEKCEVEKLGGQNASRYRTNKAQQYLSRARKSLRDGDIQDAKESTRLAEKIAGKENHAVEASGITKK